MKNITKSLIALGMYGASQIVAPSYANDCKNLQTVMRDYSKCLDKTSNQKESCRNQLKKEISKLEQCTGREFNILFTDGVTLVTPKNSRITIKLK